MDLAKLVVGCVLVACMIIFSGCTNQGTTTEKTFENIVFESDVVELYEAFLDFETEEMYDDFGEMYLNIRSVELKYLLKNPGEERVTVLVNVYLCDENNNVIYTHSPLKVNLPSGYIESNPNTVSYRLENVHLVDHAKIVAYQL